MGEVRPPPLPTNSVGGVGGRGWEGHPLFRPGDPHAMRWSSACVGVRCRNCDPWLAPLLSNLAAHGSLEFFSPVFFFILLSRAYVPAGRLPRTKHEGPWLDLPSFQPPPCPGMVPLIASFSSTLALFSFSPGRSSRARFRRQSGARFYSLSPEGCGLVYNPFFAPAVPPQPGFPSTSTISLERSSFFFSFQLNSRHCPLPF